MQIDVGSNDGSHGSGDRLSPEFSVAVFRLGRSRGLVKFLVSLMHENNAFEFGLRNVWVLGWLVITLCGACAIGAYLSNEKIPAYAFLVISLLGFYLVLGSGIYKVDANDVIHSSKFGRYGIGWHEIEKVEMGSSGTLILHGPEKRFAIPPPNWWSGPNVEKARELLVQKIEEREIVIHSSRVADYKYHKNVRLKR